MDGQMWASGEESRIPKSGKHGWFISFESPFHPTPFVKELGTQDLDMYLHH